jgi:hypothetical protein
MVRPPFCLIAFSPRPPSLPVPDSKGSICVPSDASLTHGRPAAQDVRQHAPAGDRQVEDDDEGEAARVGHGAEETIERAQSAGRGADNL